MNLVCKKEVHLIVSNVQCASNHKYIYILQSVLSDILIKQKAPLVHLKIDTFSLHSVVMSNLKFYIKVHFKSLTLKYISVYHNRLSVHAAADFNHISNTIDIVMKLHLKMYLSGSKQISLKSN